MVKREHGWGFFMIVILLAGAFVLALNAKPARATELAPEADEALCRYGVNYASSASGDSIANYNLSLLHVGWYIDYTTYPKAGVPSSIEHTAVIRLSQADYQSDNYTTNPSLSTIQQLVTDNPGKKWYIGNEPDRIGPYQDDLTPQAYARAYHDLYYLIKGIDPTAEVVAGTIVQATPVRLTYLNLMLDHYHALYDEAMPVDAWSIHGFILNEVSCEYDDTNCWGAEVPRGVDVGFGEILTVDDNDNIDLFKERIVRFRQWMAQRGYRHTPLYLSEFGVLMPAVFGFDTARVNAFMNSAFTYLQTTTDPALGYPYDGNRLVQRWAWYSVADAAAYNGWLYNPTTKALSLMGQNFATFTTNTPEQIDFYPALLTAPPVLYEGSPGTVTLYATIANSGNLQAATGPVTARFYDSNNQQIGSTQAVTLRGCGDRATVSVQWPNRGAGVHPYYVIVDGDGTVAETDETNNRRDGLALVATDQVTLPLVSR